MNPIWRKTVKPWHLDSQLNGKTLKSSKPLIPHFYEPLKKAFHSNQCIINIQAKNHKILELERMLEFINFTLASTHSASLASIPYLYSTIYR